MDDREFFPRAVGRIFRWMAIVTVAGAIAAAVLRGWTWAAGFLLGAAVSWLNFRWLRQLVENLGETGRPKPPRARVAVLLGLRYLILGAAGYAILRFSALSLTAALFGLFVAVAAVILEMVFLLVYARN